MVIPSESPRAAQVHAAIMREVEQNGFTEKQMFGIRLALEEALANAINHGNCGDPEKSVIVEYDVTPQALRVSVTDEGCGFAPDCLPDPTLEENLTKPGGRGVLLMRAYMDEVSFNNRGNCVTLVKNRD